MNMLTEPTLAGKPGHIMPSGESHVVLPVKQSSPADIWPDPQPLENREVPEPYPVESLPEIIRSAILEVQSFIKAPVPLVAASALGALSLAAQGHIDVARANRLTGPTGLFLLTIAESGERKSTCDRLFMQSIRDHEQALQEQAEPELDNYHADLAAWEAKMAGLKARITTLSKETKNTGKDDLPKAENDMRVLQKEKPKPPFVPRMLYDDITPEALTSNLATRYPIAGIISAEGGIVVGSHGMGKDSIMRNLALLNQLWDGGRIAVDRQTRESNIITAARLTVSLQIQSETLRNFFQQNGGLARGTGFLARFLISVPQSTQGTRFFSEPPDTWPALENYQNRLQSILDRKIPLTEDGRLEPCMMDLSPDAKSAWIECHDAIEKSLGKGEKLGEINDVASKAADNIARLAALFHYFEHGKTPICSDCLSRSVILILWHLDESKRFFNDIAMPQELIRLKKLDEWMIRRAREKQTHGLSQSRILQYSPVRKSEQLNEALSALQELDRIRIDRSGNTRMVIVNPKLTGILPFC